MMERVLYNIALGLGLLGFRFYALFNEKAKQTFKLRKGLLEKLREGITSLGEGPRILIHISSVGEYLQAKPIAKRLREQFPELKLCLSFFSPSGARLLEAGVEADLATYLPFDQRRVMKEFLDLIKPRLIIFSCYDLWPNLIWEAKARGIKLALINATLAENSRKIHPLVRWWFKRIYQELDLILTASEEDHKALGGLGVEEGKLITTGNARFDETMARIQALKEDDPQLVPLKLWKRKRCLVIGSSWPEDEEVIVPALERLWGEGKELQVIIAPHEIGARKLEKLRKRFLAIGVKPIFLWEFISRREGVSPETLVMVIDRTGILYKLYQLADIALVGGSFRKEVHNVMEPAGFGVPVLFGPMIKNSLEALRLKERGGGFVVQDSSELYQQLRALLEDEGKRKEAGSRAYQLMIENQGATEKILKLLRENFPELFPAGEVERRR